MIIEHPTKSGYLIVTERIQELLDNPMLVGLPETGFHSSFDFIEPDFSTLDEINDAVFRWKIREEILQAFALVILDEINILRQDAGLPERTAAQLKAAIKNRLV